jgi:ubiquinone/menaquinone biosynthesis C-methylase UbiE
MKLSRVERFLVNNGARALVQRFYEGPLLREMAGSVEGLHVLEVGCGRGVGVDLLLRQFRAAHVCGIDLDARQIERARRLLAGRDDRHYSLAVANIECLPFADASLDAVFDFGALHHVPSWQAGVAEIRRVLKPGGTFLFEEVTKAALSRWLYRTFLTHPTENRFSRSEFFAELANQGLNSIRRDPRDIVRRYLHRRGRAILRFAYPIRATAMRTPTDVLLVGTRIAEVVR